MSVSLLMFWVETKTSSMMPSKNCDWVVAPMRSGAKTLLQRPAGEDLAELLSVDEQEDEGAVVDARATCVQTPAVIGACEMTVFPVVSTTDIWMFPLWMPSENEVLLLSRLMMIG